jgi:hypothetical protein
MSKEQIIDEAYKNYEKITNDFQLENPMFGELGYPEETSFTSLERVSHQIENLEIEGDTLFAEIKILDTPRGEELKTLLDGVVFRPRIIGQLLDDNTVRVDNLISFDAIHKETDSYKDIL